MSRGGGGDGMRAALEWDPNDGPCRGGLWSGRRGPPEVTHLKAERDMSKHTMTEPYHPESDVSRDLGSATHTSGDSERGPTWRTWHDASTAGD